MSESKRPAPKDIAILSGPTEDGQGARMLRIREGGEVSTGEIRPLREGETINQAEVVRLHPLDAENRVCEVEVLHAPEDQERQRQLKSRARQETAPSGPARVSNAKYRKNWSAIFEPREAPESSAQSPKRDWSVN